MRILAVHSSNDMYGSDRIFSLVVSHLLGSGHTVEVWLPEDAPASANSLASHLAEIGLVSKVIKIPVLRRSRLRPTRLFGLAREAYRLRRHIRQGAFDQVYLGTSALMLVALSARAFTSCQVIMHVQELWSGAEGRVLRQLGRANHRCFAISGPVRAAMGSRLSARTTEITNAVRDAGPATTTASGNRLRFLVASRWNQWKGHQLLLDAWVAKSFKAELLVAGGPPSSGGGVDVPALLRERALSNEVTIVGEVAELATLIESVDVVIVPSVQPEPFGLIAIEAFALSRPVIASDAGGLAQIVHNDYNGLKFKSGEQHSLVDALERIRKMDVSQLGGNARATYDAKYSTSRFEAALQLAWPTPQVRSPARSGRRIENEDRK